MASVEEYAQRPRAERLARIARTPAELEDAVRGATAVALGRRPAPTSWAATEVFVATNPDRWAEERQYLTNEAALALAAFTRRRRETLGFLRPLAPDDWSRAGRHVDSRGRRTIDEFLSVMAWHDDNHLDQLRRALAGRP
jgi:hypothetical protein